MGSDIHSHVEVRRGGRWIYESGGTYADGEGPFGWRNYGMFGFLADVRNYSHVPVIAKPRGLPEDVSPETWAKYAEDVPDDHDASWLTVAELLAYDYDQIFWNRRITKDGNGAALAEEGEGEHVKLREFLGGPYFADLDSLARLGDPADVRVVFWFDS